MAKSSLTRNQKILKYFLQAFVFLIIVIYFHQATKKEQINRQVAQFDLDPPEGSSLSIFQKQFPTEYAAAITLVKNNIKAGKSREEISAETRKYAADFTAKNSHYVAVAPDEDLMRLLDSTIAVIEQLKTEDVKLCAAYVNKTLASNYSDEISEISLKLLEKVFIEQIIATRVGIDHPTVRTKVPEEEGVKVFDVMEKLGASHESMDKFFSADNPATLPASTECEMSAVYYKAMRLLPTKTATAMFATTLEAR